ncbi:MAG TPA: hypothetical protein VG713_21770 [Pirellulales bacterium]|nr:hypothetical protein [Pirellulales bacterium]
MERRKFLAAAVAPLAAPAASPITALVPMNAGAGGTLPTFDGQQLTAPAGPDNAFHAVLIVGGGQPTELYDVGKFSDAKTTARVWNTHGSFEKNYERRAVLVPIAVQIVGPPVEIPRPKPSDQQPIATASGDALSGPEIQDSFYTTNGNLAGSERAIRVAIAIHSARHKAAKITKHAFRPLDTARRFRIVCLDWTPNAFSDEFDWRVYDDSIDRKTRDALRHEGYARDAEAEEDYPNPQSFLDVPPHSHAYNEQNSNVFPPMTREEGMAKVAAMNAETWGTGPTWAGKNCEGFDWAVLVEVGKTPLAGLVTIELESTGIGALDGFMAKRPVRAVRFTDEERARYRVPPFDGDPPVDRP